MVLFKCLAFFFDQDYEDTSSETNSNPAYFECDFPQCNAVSFLTSDFAHGTICFCTVMYNMLYTSTKFCHFTCTILEKHVAILISPMLLIVLFSWLFFFRNLCPDRLSMVTYVFMEEGMFISALCSSCSVVPSKVFTSQIAIRQWFSCCQCWCLMISYMSVLSAASWSPQSQSVKYETQPDHLLMEQHKDMWLRGRESLHHPPLQQSTLI